MRKPSQPTATSIFAEYLPVKLSILMPVFNEEARLSNALKLALDYYATNPY